MIRLHVKDGPIPTEPEAAEKSLDLFNTLAQENDAKFSPIELEQDISIYIIIFIYSHHGTTGFYSLWISDDYRYRAITVLW